MKKKRETIDTLTNIGNSLYFYQNYINYIKKHQNTQLIMIDIEKFKHINDTFGHNIGDLYLKIVAQLLTKNFSHSLVAHIHGDEFIVLTDQSENKIKKTFDAIEKEIYDLVKKGKIPAIFRINAGSALFDAGNIEFAKEKADLMMYIAKSNGVFYQAFSEVDWKSNEREKKFLKQFDHLLKTKGLSYEKRQLFTIDKNPQNLYQIHTRNQEGASFLKCCYDDFLRKNKRQYQLDVYNLKHLKKYFSSSHQNYIIDIDYLSLLKNKEIMNLLSEYVKEIGENRIVISVKLYPETNQEDLFLLIKKIEELKRWGFQIKIDRFNSYTEDAIWLDAPVEYIGFDKQFVKASMQDPKIQYFFEKKLDMIKNYPYQSITPILSHIDTEEDFEYVNQNFDKDILVTGNYYAKSKKLKIH